MTMRANKHVIVGVYALPFGSRVLAPGKRVRFSITPMVNAIARMVCIVPTADTYVHSLNFGGGEELFTGNGPVPAAMFGPCRWGGIQFAHPELKRGVPAAIDLEYRGMLPAHAYTCASCTPTEGIVYCWSCGASEWTDFPALARCEVCGSRRHDREDPEWDED